MKCSVTQALELISKVIFLVFAAEQFQLPCMGMICESGAPLKLEYAVVYWPVTDATGERFFSFFSSLTKAFRFELKEEKTRASGQEQQNPLGFPLFCLAKAQPHG